MSTPLLILAAGVGRRFGGLKQLEPVGPNGTALMDYTVYDALRSGFDRVVLVIRRETEGLVRAHTDNGFGRRVRVDYVFQETTDIPTGGSTDRTKPWGTGHAVLAARHVLDGPFAVVNADDHYGAPAIEAVGGFVGSAQDPATWAVAGYPLIDTLPREGAVSRAAIRAENGWMRSIEELHGVRRRASGFESNARRALDPVTPVSMNLWAFDGEALPMLGEGFEMFLGGNPSDEDEYLLPAAIGAALDARRARVRVLDVRSRWCGITSPADHGETTRFISDRVADGTYPEALWS